MSLLPSPSASSSRTAASRSVTAGCGELARFTSVAAAVGDKMVSPFAVLRTAWKTSSGGASLRRYPAAPASNNVEGSCGVGRFSDDGEIVLGFDERSDSCSYDCVAVDDGDSDRLGSFGEHTHVVLSVGEFALGLLEIVEEFLAGCCFSLHDAVGEHCEPGDAHGSDDDGGVEVAQHSGPRDRDGDYHDRYNDDSYRKAEHPKRHEREWYRDPRKRGGEEDQGEPGADHGEAPHC